MRQPRFRLSLCTFSLLVLARSLHAESPRVIYGNDDRKDYFEVEESSVRTAADATVALIRASNLTPQGTVTNIETTPYGASMGLCANEPYYNQETAAFCSGFLVAPDTIVTAGHCIRDQATCDMTEFVFGFKLSAPGMQPRSVPSSSVYKCRSVVHSVSLPAGEDFAVVKMDRPATQIKPLAYRTQGQITLGEGLHVIGYPVGLPVKVAGGAHVRSLQSEFLVANLDTYGGNSGSAVFNTQTGLIEGVLVRGESDFVYANGCRSSNRCPDGGCRGEDVTLFQQVLPYIH